MEPINSRFLDGGYENLKIMSFNVSGLRNKIKRSTLFKIFKEEKIDIVALQETYLLENDLTIVEKEWGGKVILSGGTTRSKGQLLLFSKQFQQKFDITVLFSESRVILLHVKDINNEGFMIANIYAPCNNQEKQIFFQHISKTFKRFIDLNPDFPLMCVGDFNTVSNNILDIVSGSNHNEESIRSFNDLIAQLSLFDSWRVHNPNKKTYTWSRGDPVIARRLDYIFVQEEYLPFLETSEIKSLGFSDHRAVITNLKFTHSITTHRFFVCLLVC